METIDDVRQQVGNPRHGEVGGPPRTVTKFFGGSSVLRFLALALLLAGIIFVAIGVFTLVFPIAIIGFGFLAASFMVFMRLRSPD